MKILFLSNHEVTIYYFRCELIQRLLKDGNEVYVCQPYGKYTDYFESLGCKCIDSKITQYGMNPLRELSVIKDYRRIIKEISPDVVLTFTIKPNLYGGIAASLEKTPYIAAVTGIGGAFEKGFLFKLFTVLMYRAALRKAAAVFFENKSNSELFAKYKVAVGNHIVVNGSGVNLEKHPFCVYPSYDDGETRFLFIGRVMNDKGCRELFSAMRKVRRENSGISLDVVGWCEEECRDLLEDALNESLLTYHGWQENVQPFIERCSAVVLPSYHEGMANVLLEAQASGRPVLASRIPGCIEAFEDGVTGWSFESRDSGSLAEALMNFSRLLYDDKKRAGELGHKRMAEHFDRNSVVEIYTRSIYDACNRRGCV